MMINGFSLKKTFITTVLIAVKTNKQPTHTPGGPGRLRSWSGPVDPEFQGRLRSSYDSMPEHVYSLVLALSQTALKLSFNRPDQDLAWPGLSR